MRYVHIGPRFNPAGARNPFTRGFFMLVGFGFGSALGIMGVAEGKMPSERISMLSPGLPQKNAALVVAPYVYVHGR